MLNKFDLKTKAKEEGGEDEDTTNNAHCYIARIILKDGSSAGRAQTCCVNEGSGAVARGRPITVVMICGGEVGLRAVGPSVESSGQV